MTSEPGVPVPGTSRETAPTRLVLLDEPFERKDLTALRQAVAAHGDRTGLPPERVADLVLIASELASNAVRHGGGHGRLRLWTTDTTASCQVTDDGPGMPATYQLPQQSPDLATAGGRGLWLVLYFSDTITVEHADGSGVSVTATMNLPSPDTI
ncbi:ATP-binding protein [Krasilnikovia sp. MM14-A1004]|uniref:ATP-binding protein n=1 Tax=Krasilnikovia sp. MM14-A1004 TaxID=3373541 RepID=UPI00399CA9D0